MEALREPILVFQRFLLLRGTKCLRKLNVIFSPFSVSPTPPPPHPLPKQKGLCPCYKFFRILFWRFLPRKLPLACKFLATNRFPNLGTYILGASFLFRFLYKYIVSCFINKISPGSRSQPTIIFLLIVWSSLGQRRGSCPYSILALAQGDHLYTTTHNRDLSS